MLKQLIGLIIETKNICIDIVAITGKSSGDPLYHIPPALKIYKKLMAYGLTDDEANELIDNAVRKHLKGEPKS